VPNDVALWERKKSITLLSKRTVLSVISYVFNPYRSIYTGYNGASAKGLRAGGSGRSRCANHLVESLDIWARSTSCFHGHYSYMVRHICCEKMCLVVGMTSVCFMSCYDISGCLC
jgi:hypothetical protein